MVALGEVAEINPRMPKGLDEASPVSFLPMAAVSETGRVEYEEERTLRDVKKGYTYFQRDDVLLAKITPCFENGKAAQAAGIAHQVGFGSTEFHVIRGGRKLDPRYAFHLLWGPAFRELGTKNMTGSAGQKRVPKDLLNRLKIPLPPLAEQRRIAAILDKADGLRRKRREALALLDTLNQSIFVEMFGDLSCVDRVHFKELLIKPLRNGLSPSKAGTVSAPVLTLSALTSGSFLPDKVKEGTFKVIPPANQCVIEGEFLICRGNGNRNLVGIGIFVDQSLSGTAFPDTVIAGRINEQIVSHEYLAYIWNSQFVRPQIEAPARTTNGTFKVNQSGLEGVEIPLPSLALQKSFSEKIARLNSVRLLRFDQLERLDTLFASLQSRAFNGTL
jgi:type I restriction enzyme S subunit